MPKPPKPDRLTINLQGLRQRIENYRTDEAWKQLSTAAKIRAMIEELLGMNGQIADSIAQLVDEHWENITDTGLDITGRRLKEIREGDRPNDEELIELATCLPLDAHQLMELRSRTFTNGGKSHGRATKKV